MIPDVGAMHFQTPYYTVAYDSHILWHLVDQHGNRSCCYNRCADVAREICDRLNGHVRSN